MHNLRWLVERKHHSNVPIGAVNDANSDSLMDLLLNLRVKCVALGSVHPILNCLAFEPYYVVLTMLPTIGDALNVSIYPFEYR